MQISAINFNNSFKGRHSYDEVIDVPSEIVRTKSFDDVMDRVDLNQVADTIKNVPDNKTTAPIKTFALTAIYTLAAFAATKRVSQAALKSLEGKLSLDKPLNKLGKIVSKKINVLKAQKPVDVTSVGTFFKSAYTKTTKLLATAFDTIGRAGITEADKALCKKQHLAVGAFAAKNAMRKITSTALGVGTAGVTVSARTKDKDGNGVPDCAENKESILGTVKAVAEVLPGLDAAISAAA
ncbi:MAG: hypothetical protein MJ180_00750 [Candidatus Gastranaerophilales bacterium]|nr:hypothetical protein [Candidatus Gastranaerophilales bacterium]